MSTHYQYLDCSSVSKIQGNTIAFDFHLNLCAIKVETLVKNVLSSTVTPNIARYTTLTRISYSAKFGI